MSYTTFQHRRDTAGNWATENPVLAQGEIGLQVDGSGNIESMKIGNGTDDWATLPFFTTGTSIEVGASTDGLELIGNELRLDIDALPLAPGS